MRILQLSLNRRTTVALTILLTAFSEKYACIAPTDIRFTFFLFWGNFHNFINFRQLLLENCQYLEIIYDKNTADFKLAGANLPCNTSLGR